MLLSFSCQRSAGRKEYRHSVARNALGESELVCKPCLVKRIALWVSALVASAIITTILAQAVEAFLVMTGWFSVEWLSVFAEEAWKVMETWYFGWVAGGALGLSVGIWLDVVMSRFDGRRPIWRADKMRKLGGSVGLMGARCERAASSLSFGKAPSPGLWVESALLIERLEKIGLSAPSLSDGENYHADIRKLAFYFKSIGPLLNEAHPDAQELSKDLVENLDKTDDWSRWRT